MKLRAFFSSQYFYFFKLDLLSFRKIEKREVNPGTLGASVSSSIRV
jgi:hypothetical protein